jgi:hypothetical protein
MLWIAILGGLLPSIHAAKQWRLCKTSRREISTFYERCGFVLSGYPCSPPNSPEKLDMLRFPDIS